MVPDDVRKLPWPVQWGPLVKSSAIVSGVLGAVAVAAVFVTGTIASVMGDSTGVILLLGSPILAVAAGGWIVVNTRDRNRRSPSLVGLRWEDDLDSEAVVVPYALGLYLTYVFWPVAILVFFGPVFLVSLVDVAQRPQVRDVATLGILTVSGVANLYAVWFAFDLITSRWSRGRVALSADGLYHRSAAFSSYVPWEGMTIASPIDRGGPFITIGTRGAGSSWFRRTSMLWKQEELAFAPHIAIRGRWLSVDPATMYYAVRFYLEHPDARPELSTTVGVDRLRSGGFPI